MSLTRPSTREPEEGASQPLFLSLFLLLLAFFILLNALSTIEPGRSNRVLESVQRAFPSAYRAELGEGLLDGDPGQVIGEATRNGIGEIFRQVLPVARVTVEPDGNPIYVEAPLPRVYAGRLTPAGERLAARLATFLATPPAGSVLELDVLLSADPADRGPGRAVRARDAADLVDAMVGFGIEPSLMAAGLEPGAADRVRFIFRTRPADTGRGSR